MTHAVMRGGLELEYWLSDTTVIEAIKISEISFGGHFQLQYHLEPKKNLPHDMDQVGLTSAGYNEATPRHWLVTKLTREEGTMNYGMHVAEYYPVSF